MSSRYWFRPKSFGYGATPVTWQGWALTLGSLAVFLALILAAIFVETQHWSGRRPLQVACPCLAAATLIALIIISRRKTDGEWRW